MSIVTQHSYNAKQPTALRPTDLPGRIPTYAEASEMSQKLDLWLMRRRHGWVTGKSAFMLGTKKTLDKNPSTKDRGRQA